MIVGRFRMVAGQLVITGPEAFRQRRNHMRKLICWLFGHKFPTWHHGGGYEECPRCHMQRWMKVGAKWGDP